MPYKIGKSCIACGCCIVECSSGAITEGIQMYVIDQDICVSCGTCVEVCSQEAIADE